MIPGNNRPPYRAPCAGTVLCGTGPRYQNAKASEKNIPVWLYNGLVTNWDECPGQSANVAPYERPNPTYLTPSNDDCGGSGTTYTQPPGPWISTSSPSPGPDETFDLAFPPPVSWYQPQMLTGATINNGGINYVVGDILDAAGGTLSSYIAPPGGPAAGVCNIVVTAVNGSGTITGIAIHGVGSYQTIPSSPNAVTGLHGTGASINFTFGNQMENLQQCKKIGFKNVQAKRQWHGQPGYFFNGGGASIISYCCPGGSIGMDWDYTNSASQTKYGTLSWSVSGTNISGAGITDSASGEISVNAQSGVLTVQSYDTGSGAALAEIAAFISLIGSNALALAEFIATPYGADVYSSVDYTCSGNSIQMYDTGDPGSPLVAEVTWSSSPGSFTATQNARFNYNGDGAFDLIMELSISDSSATLTITANNGDGSFMDLTSTCTLSNAITASALQGDINTLLSKWPLNDDALYPWRSDANTSMAPLVSRNEVPANIAPASALGEAAGWTDPNSLIYDGSILGAPMPAGYQGFFDFRWEDYQIAGFIGGLPDYEIFGWGEKNIGQYGIPLNATQWSNVDIGLQFPGGAWIFYNLNPSVAGNGNCFNPGTGCPTPATVLYAQKWAETKAPFPSQNFFRPAGNDRFVYDESQVYSILSTSGGPGSGTQINLGLTTSCAAASGVVASGLWGPYQNTDGKWYFWSVTGGGASVTLNAPVYLMPDNWQSASGDGSAASPATLFCFGKLRWSTGNPATDPFPILGRAGVSAVAEYMGSSSVTELTTDALPNLGMIVTSGDYDTIDIYDKTMTLLAGNAQVTRIDDSHFTVPVALATIQNAAWIQSHGSPAYYWDDEFPKGDYVYTDWTYWPRQVYEPERINGVYQACAGIACGGTPTTSCDCSEITCETPAANVLSAFTETAGCVPFNPCNPSVLAITPNGESFANGVTFGFASINLDEQYGSGWQAEFQQVMTDLLWQVPHVPATSPCTAETTAWTEDNGSCESNTDTQTFFAHRPLVEARLTVPAGAPALPAGITIGWLSPVTHPTSPDALYPASSNGGALGGFAPWNILDMECNCIQSSGRFADVYENQVVTCD